jgi:hypothetical protein
MKVYLIHHPNGDIYHRSEDSLVDDIQDMMSVGECRMDVFRNDLALEDGERPLFGLIGNNSIKNYLSQREEN